VAEEQQHAASASGMPRDVNPSLEQVEKVRFELWLLSTVLLVGFTMTLAVLNVWPGEDIHRVLTQPYARYGVVAVASLLSAYSLANELSLRRVARQLVDERLLTTALAGRLHEISTLLDAGRAVNSTLELDRVLASILSGATDLMPATSGSVMLVEGDEMVVAAAVGNSRALGRRAALGDGIAGHVARTREPLLINGRATPSRFPGLGKRVHDVASAMCVPLLERGVLLGVLNLSAERSAAFTEYDLRALSLFAEQASAAIGKARLYAQSQEQAHLLAHAANHDALTGLANRSALEQGVTAGDTLLFLDLDGFKTINDRLGHAAGDEVLVSIAKRIRGNVASKDLVARFGGDEFAVLLRDVTDPAVARMIAGRVLAAIAQPLEVEGHRASVTGSIGIAMPRSEPTPLAVLLRQADQALYAAKAEGKDCIKVFESSTPRHGEAPVAVPAPRGRRSAQVAEV
jgi:diguanylate cyclase (GGDEF)-like protein